MKLSRICPIGPTLPHGNPKVTSFSKTIMVYFLSVISPLANMRKKCIAWTFILNLMTICIDGQVNVKRWLR